MAFFNPSDFGGGFLPFEDRFGPAYEAVEKGQFDPQGANNLPPPGPPAMSNAQMFPGYGTGMAAGGPQMPAGEPEMPPQGMPPQGYSMPSQPAVMPSLGGMAPVGRAPDIGDRLQAAGAGFFNAGSPMQAIGNLLGGLFTGQRQDPAGIRAQMFGQAQAASQASTAQSVDAAMEYIQQDPSIPPPVKNALLRNPQMAIKYFSEMVKPLPPKFSGKDVGGVGYTFNENTGQWSPPQTALTVKPGEITEFRKEVYALPEVKRYSTALPIFRSMVENAKNPSSAADLDFVYGIAKIFDPESVVREGEMKLVGHAQSIPEAIKGQMEAAVMGRARLTPEARARILETARVRMGELEGSVNTTIEPYKGRADRAKIRHDDVFPQFQPLPEVPKAPQEAAPAELPRVKSVSDALKLPKGTRFIDPNGVERVRP
jgi:hypothetical protein